MTKKVLFFAAASLLFSNVYAQTVEEGIKMIRYERYESAKKILAPLAGSNSLANYYLGIAELGLENTEAAKQIFAKQPEDAANLAGMSRVYFAEKKTTEGFNQAKAVAEKAKKKNVEPYKFAADAITYSNAPGYYVHAVDYYKKVLEKGEDANIYISLGDAHLKTSGGGGEAMTAYENAIRIDPKNSLAYSRIGALWYAAKRYDLALDNYGKAKEADPTNPLPYRDLASAYYYVNKFELSKQNIEEYLKHSDQTAEDQLQYVSILYRAKDYTNVITKAQDLLNKGSKNPGLYGIIAYSQLETGDSVAALENIKKYFALQKPEKIGAEDYSKYGSIWMKNGQVDSGVAYFQKAIDMDSSKNKGELYRTIAEAYKDQKTEAGYAEAGKWYGKIIDENPSAPALDYFYWGMYHYYGKNYDDAAKAYKAMEEKYPEQPSATYWRGRVAAAQDLDAKKGLATEHYTKWLSTSAEKNPKDLMQAYQWLALHYFYKKDKANMDTYVKKILEIEPGNTFVKQLKF